jgi:hypothetical protein
MRHPEARNNFSTMSILRCLKLHFVACLIGFPCYSWAEELSPVVESANWHPATTSTISSIPSPPFSLSDSNGKLSLDGKGWQLQNTLCLTNALNNANEISSLTYPAKGWLPASVPGTVLANYLADGLIPDPNFGANQKLISESFFQHDFWYRREFIAPPRVPHQHWFLNFDGINWKAEIYLNGKQIGRMDGAFCRGKFDVTDKLVPKKSNVLAVLIHPCANPGPTNVKSIKHSSHNGGILGKDSPTFLASVGWNWMPSIRGRNIGIWDHVFLEQMGSVMLEDPFVHSTVAKDLHHAALTVQVTLRNLESVPVEGSLKGTLGAICFTQKIRLAANETKTLTFDPPSCPQLSLTDPPLWWPNGYGDQPLQQLKLTVSTESGPITQKEVTFGIRELSYDTSDKILKILCNGQRIQLNGGNWGMDETMLRYGAADYDTAVRLHKEMHMTMIRNWVGEVGKEEFFDACDKYGLLVWNDFWLANPADGDDPDDHAMFMTNVKDRILRIRNHPSLALYCGRNEGLPPKDLDEQMAAATTALDGARLYIPDSADGLVSGRGPYEPKTDVWYFQNRGKTLHSELGIVCVPTADTIRLMMPEKDLWPISDMWYLHDFHQSRCRDYTRRIDQSYGPSDNLDQFCEKAQMENWENAKAMMEAWRSKSGSGVLIWMSHPAWPSLICQLYDYYLNPTASYFGVKKANEPLHILWDASSGLVKVANNTGKNLENLHAEAWIYNMDGTEASHQESTVNSGADGIATDCFVLDFPPTLSPVHFIKLLLSEKKGNVVSENFYWHSTARSPAVDANQKDKHKNESFENYLALNDMKPISLNGSFSAKEIEGKTTLTITLENPTSQIALMAAVKVVLGDGSSKRMLPIYYDDNYVTLLPREKREVHAEFETALLKRSQPSVLLTGWNIQATTLSPTR